MSRPQVWIFAGPNGAGKSTLTRKHVAGRIEVVNPDDIARDIEPDHRGEPSVMMQAGRLAVERRHALLYAGESFAIETTLIGHGELAFMAEARAKGYKVNLVFIGHGGVANSRSRVFERVRRGGHPVPVADLERRYGRSMGNLAKAMKIAHRTLVIDNTNVRTRLLLSREASRTKHVSRSMPKWAKQAIPVSLRRDSAYELGL